MLKRITLFAVSLTVSLIGVEIYLRVQHARQQKESALLATGGIISSPVPGLYYEPKPNPPWVNSRGYNDVEHRLKKPEGVFRIVVIGDSIAAGHEMELEDRFTRILESTHNERFPDRPIEIILLARSGYCTAQELVLLRQYALDYEPGLILWSYALNDPADPFYHGANGDLMVAYNPPCHLTVLLRKGLIGLSELFADERADEEFHRRLHLLYRDRVVEAFDEIGRFSKENDVPVVVVLHPVFTLDPNLSHRADQPYQWQDLHDDLRSIIESRSMRVIDIQNAYQGAAPADLSLPGDPWHPNKEGNRRAAQWILEHLDLPKGEEGGE